MTHDDATQESRELRELVSWCYRQAPAEALPCPGEATLCDFMEGRLPDAVAREVELHLAHCAGCTQVLAAAADLPDCPAGADVPGHVLRRALALVPETEEALLARLLRRCRGLWQELAGVFVVREPEWAYVRGSKKVISKNLVLLEKVFKSIRLDIEIEKIGAQASNIKVQAHDPAGGAPLSGIRICLCDDGREIASFVTVVGEALFEHIAFGQYKLSAWRQNEKQGEVRITIKE